MSTPPIFNLDNDILLTILDIITQQIPNTNNFLQEGRPAIAVRAASQVCPRWRGLLLASPWIWGRVIDLDVLPHGPQRFEWMEEVVRRAGSAPLWISGDVIDRREYTAFNQRSYFIRLLEYWERIERLSVVFYDNEIPDSIQSRFLSPAPSLKLFDVHLPGIEDPLFLDTLQPGSSQCLFANHAPLLMTIKADVAFKSDSSWLSNIREINFVSRRTTVNSFMTLLQHTPNIESITLNTRNRVWDVNQRHSSFPKPRLPKLSSIWIGTTLAAGARILEYISPGKLSAFHIRISDSYLLDLEDDSILHSFKKNLPVYISNYFTWNQLASTAVLLHITVNSSFRFRNNVTAENIFDDSESFNIHTSVRFDNQLDNDKVIACLLDTFTLGCTLGVNPFRLTNKMCLRFDDVQSILIPNIYSMLANFHHVQDIETDDCSTQTLLDIFHLDEIAKDGGSLTTSEQVGAVLFPELRTLRLTWIHFNGSSVSPYLLQFLMERKKIGFPVAKLDLTDCRTLNYKRDLRGLEEVNGLEVVWKESEHAGSGKSVKICTYICGTGKPERLIIDLDN